jgi:hypothetical protein
MVSRRESQRREKLRCTYPARWVGTPRNRSRGRTISECRPVTLCRNIEVAVAAAGGSRTDIVSLRLYIVGDDIHNSLAVREALLGFFPTGNPPTSTWIGVSALASKDFLIEIEAVAVLE